MKLVKIASGVSASVALLGAGGAASMRQAQVQATVKYQIRMSKKAYVYTTKGKKTKKSYKKNAKVTAYGTKWIKGKKYYRLDKGRYIRISNAKKVVPRYSYSTQSKKITRTIKMYQPKGVKKVIQNAYIKRSVRIDNKTKKKTYGAWSTSSWKKYKVTKVSGYTASRSSVGAAKVTYKRKNQTIKITYKAFKKTNKKKQMSKKTDAKPATKPSITPSKPANSGSSGSTGNPGSSSSSSSSSSNNSGKGDAGPSDKPSKPTNSSSSSESKGSSRSPTNNGGMAATYKLEVKDATITPGTTYDSTAFEIKYSSTGVWAPVDVIKSISVDTAKIPFAVSFPLEYGVYNLKASPATGDSGIYSVPVTVTYQDGTHTTFAVKITVPTIKVWDENTKVSARTKILDVINDFRSKVGEHPVALDTTPEYQTFMDQRAAEKAKIFADTGQHDHSGDTLAVKYGVYSGEYVGTTTLNAGDSLNDQTSQATASVRSGVQAEKDDYEAIYIRHERTNITNGAGTVGHYENFINQNFIRVVIGTGTYVKDGVAYTAIVMAEIMNEK